jgi:DNA-binding CsgD family transcriptional regulator
LSSTELTVAERAAEGLTNRQIGEVLFMSRYTVDTHLRHIFAKLSLNSRVDLAGVVRQHHEQLAGALAPSPSHPAVGPAGTSGAAGVEVRAGRGFPASVAVQQ